jgi:hypothetical protein
MTEHLNDLPSIDTLPVMGQAFTRSAATNFQLLSGAF